MTWNYLVKGTKKFIKERQRPNSFDGVKNEMSKRNDDWEDHRYGDSTTFKCVLQEAKLIA